MKYLLMVTWIYPQQPPASYQLEFQSIGGCVYAREKVYAQVNELRRSAVNDAKNRARAMGLPEGLMSANVRLVDATAVCIPQ